MKKLIKAKTDTEGREKSNENLVTRGKGRPVGSKNHVTKSAKEAFHFAFEKNGGAKRLAQWAKSSDSNYGKFMQLYSKLIPVDLTTQEEKIVVREISTMPDEELVKLFAEANTILSTQN